MAFKTTQSQEIPAAQFERALQIAVRLGRAATTFRDQALAGSVRVADLHSGLLATLINSRNELVKAQATAGIGAYAQEQFNDPAYDVGVEFTAMMAEIDATTAWFEANFPQDGAGHLLVWTFVGDGSGAFVSDTITAAGPRAALVNRLNALISTID